MISEHASSGRWSPRRERVAVALWAAFLAAIVEVGVFFSYINPWVVDHVPVWLLDPWAIYGVVFLFFWLCAFAATSLTAYMLSSGRGALIETRGARDD